MKKLKLLLLLPLIIIGTLVIINYPRLNIATGYSAKNVCSCIFEADRDLKSIEEGDNDISPVYLVNNRINMKEKSVASTFFGLKKKKAFYYEGIGCVLANKDDERLNFAIPNRNVAPKNLPYPYGNNVQNDTVFKNIDYDKLQQGIDYAFDKEGEDVKKTRAVVVIYKDHIIGEKYGFGFSKETKLLGWSMTKSITSAVLGLLEKQGRIRIHQDKLFEAWRNDSRSKITLNNLLQMNSGLEWDEDYNTISDITKMLYLETDMTKSQLRKSQVTKANQSWNYSSGTTNLLSGFIRKQFKTHQEYLDFWYSELIDKIGMHSMNIETDLTGNYIGSSYGWATPRDWAKFGLLYLHKGNWNGDQLLNESWIDYTVNPTEGSDGQYGAHFWLNAGRSYPNAPKDLFSCNGYQGQYIFIIPSKDLVIVRMGLSEHPIFNVDEFLEIVVNSIE